jgi:regulator of RNase E activity RraA
MPPQVPDIKRPDKKIVEALADLGSATVSSTLSKLGIRDVHLTDLPNWTPGKSIAGPAVTLQFMPKREDQYKQDEYSDPEEQLHRHALYVTQPGDIVVVDARGNMSSGVFGDMMLTYFAGKGGAGVVIDGCIRDWPKAQKLESLGFWLKGTTPNFHTQTDIFPYAVNVPIACCDTLVVPGDIIVADDDGVAVVPVSMTDELLERASFHHEWEDFSRERLMQGGDLRRYYPLHDDARDEYEQWKKEKGL